MRCPISNQTLREERFNTLTHFFGLVLSVIGCIYLAMISSQSQNSWAFISSLVYGTTLLSLYAASTCYHHSKSLQQKQKFKIADHVCIYLLIAGSYTPFTLGPLLEFSGFQLLATVWTIALLGILLKIAAINRFQGLSLVIYLGLGWLVVFSFETLMEQMSLEAITWLIAGGISYTCGTIFYIFEKIPFNHGIWHLFVLAGSICHYFSILALI